MNADEANVYAIWSYATDEEIDRVLEADWEPDPERRGNVWRATGLLACPWGVATGAGRWPTPTRITDHLWPRLEGAPRPEGVDACLYDSLRWEWLYTVTRRFTEAWDAGETEPDELRARLAAIREERAAARAAMGETVAA